MILKLVLLFVLALVGLGLIAREILVVGEARRSGQELRPVFRRFRRRAKGILLLWTVCLFSAFHGELAATFALTPHEHFLLMGTLFIGVIWVLILAGRDLHETTQELVSQRQAITLEALDDIKKAIDERKAAGKAAAPHASTSTREKPKKPWRKKS